MKKEHILRRICGLLLGLLFNPFVLMHAAELPSPVDGGLTITVSAENELYGNYPAADITATGATKLKIIGPLGSNDFSRLKDVVDETLTQLDLSEAVFTALPSSAFSNESTLTAITLPAGLTSIGSFAFSQCSSLATLTLEVTGGLTVGYNAFYYCTQLATMTINAGGDVTLGNIGTSNTPFNHCTALETFELHTPGKVMTSDYLFNMYVNGPNPGYALTTVMLDARGEGSTMGKNAFNYCANLTNVTLPASLNALSNYFFSHCSSLTTVDIPSSVTAIGLGAFEYCSALESLDLSETQVATIDRSVFTNCTSLASVLLPASLTSIGSSTFSQCSGLESLDLSHTQLTEIPNNTCFQCTSLASVQLPATVSTIGSSAFYRCSSLSAFTIDVTGELSIADGAFNYCSQLAAVTINAGGDVRLGTSYKPFDECMALETFELHTPGKLTATCNYLFYSSGKGYALTTAILDAQGEGSAMGTYAFANCKSLSSVTLPSSLSTINSMFFYNCSSLTSVTIPSTLSSIGSSAFSGCTALESLDFSATQITSIESQAFSSCTSLASVLLPVGITSLDSNVFYNCSSLQSLDLSQALMTEIPNSTCYQCSSLTSVQLPATITRIGSNAFAQCQLTSFGCISNGALTIENSAFYYCRQLTDVSLTAAGALTIAYAAFNDCSALREVTINAGGDVTIGTTSSVSFDRCYAMETFELHTSGKVTLPPHMFYVGTSKSSLRRVWLDATGEGSTIGNYAFQYCRLLEDLLLPAGLTSLGQQAFLECNSLTAIDLPATTTIANGDDMFYNCSSLESIDLSQLSMTALGNRAFSSCSALTSVQLPDGFTTIGESMFKDCSSLPSIYLPATITSIGQQAFYGCSSLSTIIVPMSVTTMGNEVFRNCSSLTAASVLGDIGTLPQRTFQDCSLLRWVTLGEGNTAVGDYAFYGCSQLADIHLPSGLTTLGQQVFYNCSSLSMIELPTTLTTLGNHAFGNCSSLLSLEIPEGVSELPQSVFYGCSGMQSLYLPSTITTMSSALSDLSSLIDLHIQATTPPPLTSAYGRANLVTLFVPEASISAYQAATNWSLFYRIYAELTDLSTLDDGDFALLQQFYEVTHGNSWTRPWPLGTTKETTPMLEGVKVSDGHVVQLALINNGIRGQLPQVLMQFPQLWYINLSRNQFSGDLGAYFSAMSPNSIITHLDLSDNQLTGNIGLMGNAASESLPDEKLSALVSLKLARNQIRDVKPVLPAHITTLDLKGQEVDINTTYRFSDFIDTDPVNMPNLFPSILTYNHSKKDYSNSSFLLWAPNAEQPWTVSVYKYSTSVGTGGYYNNSGWNFLPIGSEICLANTPSEVADRIRLRLDFDYRMGDVNYNYDVEVSDLQKLINFALQPEKYQRNSPFNWYAANTILADGDDSEVINVQDVVGEVNLLLEEDYNPSLARRSSFTLNSSPRGEGSGYHATFTIEDGQLVLDSKDPIAAFDLSVSGDVEWSSELNLFSRKSRGCRTIFYSMMGDVLPVGRNVLGKVSADAGILAASLSDAEGTLIPVAIGDTATGISERWNVINEKSIYDLHGRRINGSLKKGVYVVNGKKVVK